MKIYIDGKFHSERDAKVSVFDHGLLYGDGVFEGIRAYNGRVFKLKEHIERLFASAKAILLAIPLSPDALGRAVVETCRRNKLRDAYIRLVVTRGPGGLGLDPKKCPKASIIIIAGALFSLIHMGGVSWHVLPGLFILGLILGWLYETHRSLWPS
ncbi:MAG: CPBP family intramembrane metalloprotease, partial [Rhodobacteraceae bacterium]|nr:CPBP family intramembrane metalloprotease [Paracoccaceae bacterium]